METTTSKITTKVQIIISGQIKIDITAKQFLSVKIYLNKKKLSFKAYIILASQIDFIGDSRSNEEASLNKLVN